nr:reverse transcriptase domain-containing protein [Tanacetum cinerariifolium]
FMANLNRGTDDAKTDGAETGGARTGGAKTSSAGTGSAEAGGAEAGGARPAVPEITRCTYVTFMKCNPQPFKGTKGAVGLLQWLKGTDIDGYTNRFHEWALLCPRMVEPKQVKVEQYIRGLSKNIRGDVTSSSPASIDEAVCMAYQLMGHIIQDKTDEAPEGEKQKGEGDRGGRGDNHRQNQRRANAGAMTNAALNDNKKLGAIDAQQDPKVITGTFLLNNRYAIALFDSVSNKSFVSTKFSTLIDIEPVKLDTFYDVKLADGKV